MADKLSLAIKETGIDITGTEDLLKKFSGFFADAKEIADEAKTIIVKDATDIDGMQKAREVRLKIQKIRTKGVEPLRKQLKEQSLREGRTIDGISNLIKGLIVPVEEYLEKQEKFAEKVKEENDNKTEEKRIGQLKQYVDDIEVFTLHPKDMSTETFNQLLKTSKIAHEAQKKAEKEAEEQRVKEEKEEKARQEKIRLDNIRLKKEADEKEKKLIIERKAKEKAERKIRLAKEKKEANEKAKKEAKRKALLAPDKVKILKLANEFELIQSPAVSSNAAQQILNEAKKQLKNTISYLREKAETL